MARGLKLEVYLRGGLGNQLFQYCSGLHFAEQQGSELVLRTDLLPEVEDKVDGISRWPLQISGFNHSGQILDKKHQPQGKTNARSKFFQAMRYLGDMQPKLTEAMGWISSERSGSIRPPAAGKVKLINSYATFKAIAVTYRSRLRSEVHDLKDPSVEFLALQKSMRESMAPIVHLRRGDYIGLENIYGTLEDSYFLKALKLVRERGLVGDPWLFSDSPGEVPKKLSEDLGVSRLIGPDQLPSPLENLVLMSSSKALICSNSSFSWWASLISEDASVVVGPILDKAKTNNFSSEDHHDQKWMLIHAP